MKENVDGKFQLRVKGHDKRGYEKASKKITITVDQKTVPARNITSKIYKITAITLNPDYESCKVSWEGEKSSQPRDYKVLLYSSLNVNSFSRHVDAWTNNDCWVKLTTPGTYYFCVVEASSRDRLYTLPETTQEFKKFILPLKRPGTPITKLSESQSPDRGVLTLEFDEVKNATSYELWVNGDPLNPSDIKSYTKTFDVKIELPIGNHTIKLKALNQHLDVESDFREFSVNIKRIYQQLQLEFSEITTVRNYGNP